MMQLLLDSNASGDPNDPLLAFAKSQPNSMVHSSIINQVQWVIEDMSCASSLDRRVIEYHDGSKFIPNRNVKEYQHGYYRLISLAGAFHNLPTCDYFPAPYGAYTGKVHINNIETLSKYEKVTLHRNADFQPLNFRRKQRTTFVLKDDISKHVIDMSVTKYSEQGLENLEDCVPCYEVEYDYNGKDPGKGKQENFVRGVEALLYSASVKGRSKATSRGSAKILKWPPSGKIIPIFLSKRKDGLNERMHNK